MSMTMTYCYKVNTYKSLLYTFLLKETIAAAIYFPERKGAQIVLLIRWQDYKSSHWVKSEACPCSAPLWTHCDCTAGSCWVIPASHLVNRQWQQFYKNTKEKTNTREQHMQYNMHKQKEPVRQPVTIRLCGFSYLFLLKVPYLIWDVSS